MCFVSVQNRGHQVRKDSFPANLKTGHIHIHFFLQHIFSLLRFLGVIRRRATYAMSA